MSDVRLTELWTDTVRRLLPKGGKLDYCVSQVSQFL